MDFHLFLHLVRLLSFVVDRKTSPPCRFGLVIFQILYYASSDYKSDSTRVTENEEWMDLSFIKLQAYPDCL